MSLDEESLETAANGGAIDSSKWPNLVEPLLERLQHNVYNAFPMPRVPAAPAQPPTLPSAATILAQDPTTTTNNSTSASNSADTTNPPNLQTPPRPTATSPTTTPLSSSERIPDSQPGPSSSSTNASALPAPLDHLLTAISTNIRTLFASKPPHTIQRLAELILRPTAHYRTLPAYLRAVDRVVSVTSPADIFPFQTTTGTQQPVLPHHQQPNGTLNGSAAAAAAAAATEPSFMFSVDNALGSDESLGGALLTPIPWLHNAASSPDGDGDQETANGGIVGVIGQSETGFVAAAETTTIGSGGGGGGGEPTTATTTGEIDPENEVMGGMESVPAEPLVEDIPHARGPPVVGVEDLGLQDGKGVEMNLDGAAESGQQQQDQTQESQESAASLQGGPQQQEQQSSRGEGRAQEGNAKPGTDGDGDIALEDAKAEEVSATSDKDQQHQKQG